MIRRLWSEQVRVTFWAWVATLGAAAMLAPLTASKRYLLVGAFGAALVSITGAALRARRAHLIIVLLAEVAVACEWAILTFARQNAILGFIPGPDAVSDLRDRWSGYMDAANQYAAPLPQHDDVTMAMSLVLVALGIVVDVVAASWRRASLLGLVFLAIYMTPVSILGGEVSIVTFLFGALGYVFLLAADERERLTHWGRQISTAGSLWDRPSEVDEGGLRRNGARVGLGAIALAAVLPILIPTLSPHYFGQSGSGGPGGSGDGDVNVDDDPALDLRRNLFGQSDEVLLEFSTTDPDPEYFRLAALDDFDGEEWSVGERSDDNAVPANDELPLQTDIEVTVPSPAFNYDVEITDRLNSRWLPLRYLPTTIHVDQGWSLDRTNLDAYTDEGSTAGLSYSFTADLVQPTRGQMRAAAANPPEELADYLDLPDDLPQEFRDLARQMTDGERTPYDQADALQDWFHSSGDFEYSIDADDVAGPGIDDLVEFLTESRIGYCEQFAAAMAIMARTLDIPARVAVGFLEPEQVGDDTWRFKGTDMHAWPELYFAGVGWTRFEPTPNTNDSEGAEPLDFPVVPSTSTALPTVPETPTANTRTPQDADDSPSEAPVDDENAGSGGGSDIWWIAPLIVVGLAIVVSLPRLAREVVRRRRWRAVGPIDTAEAAWAELRDHVLDLRLEWDSGATPRAIGRSLRERLPDDRPAGGTVVASLNRLVLAIEQGRYARTIRRPDGLREAVETVTEVLSSRQTPRQRLLARWLPASLLRARRRHARGRDERLGGLLVSVED